MSLKAYRILLILLLGTPLCSHAELIFEGVSPQVLNQIKSELPTMKDSESSPALADQLVRRLMKTQLYEKVSAVEADGQNLKIIAVPLRKISRLTIEGYDVGSETEIRQIINLKEGEKFDRRKATDAAEALKEYYGKLGYFNTVINVSFHLPNEGEVDIRFDINEGEPCKITSIVFETQNSEIKSLLEASTRRFINKPFTENILLQINERAQNVFRTKRYLKAKLQQSKAEYNPARTKAQLFYIVEDPIRYQVVFDGNKQFSQADVLRALALDEMDRPMIDPESELAQKLRARYMASGFAHVKVTTKTEEGKTPFLTNLKLEIVEGPKVKIQSIEVTGRISRPSKYYADFIHNNSTDLIDRGYYNREDLEIGYKNLITQLKNEGYLSAKLQSYRIEYLNNRSQVKILLTMDEGPLTQVRKIQFKGVSEFSTLDLLKQIDLKTNSPLHLNQLESSLAKLKAFYRSQGYLEMKVLNEDSTLIEYNESGTQANLNFEIYEGPKIVVSAIAVDGNTFTKDFVVLHEIDFEVGDVLTQDKIDTSLLRLNRLGIFSRAEIRTLEAGTNVSQRTVVVSVSERNPGLFRFGAGVNNERELTVRGFTGFTYSNLGGTARAISGRVELENNLKEEGELQYRVGAAYLEPFLFNSRTRGRVSLTFFKDRPTGLDTIQQGSKTDLTLERDLTNHTKLTWTLWSLDSTTYPISQQVALIGPTLDIDFRDNIFLPTRGSYTHWALQYSDPALGSSELINFYKTEGNYNYYLRLGSPRFVWANTFRAGYLKNISDKAGSGVPANQAFFLGGFSTIRGYGGTADLEVIPNRIEFPPGESGTDLVVKNESSYYLMKSELRFPIYGILGGAIFYDAGEVKVSGETFEKPFKQSAGFGIRIDTPVGPIVFDLAYKIDPLPGQTTNRFHFSIGTF